MQQASKPALVRNAISKALLSVTFIRRLLPVYAYSHVVDVKSPLITDQTVVDDGFTSSSTISGPDLLSILTPEEIRFISQCEMSLPEFAVSSLTAHSPLRAWLTAWDEAGILSEAARAMLGNTADLVVMLKRNKLCLSELGEHEWPMIGLRSLLERERNELNIAIRHGTPVSKASFLPGSSTLACLFNGADAPMQDWLRVWIAAGISSELVAAVSGVGYRHLPGSAISQCEKNRALWQVQLLAYAKSKRMSPSYVVSGFWLEGKDSTYAYIPTTREQIPSIDTYNWIAGHGLGVTRQQFGSHPIQLIMRVLGDRVNEVHGKHCLGLLIESLPLADALLPRITPQVVDVIRGFKLRTALSQSDLGAIEINRMPGVYPFTWIVDCDDADSGIDDDPYLCRVVGETESSVNALLNRIAGEVQLPGITPSSFRIAKCSRVMNNIECKYVMRYPAHQFATVIDSHATVASLFRLPLGSLLSSTLILDGGQRRSLVKVVEQVVGHLKVVLACPSVGLSHLLHWIIFDAVCGSLAQMPYRYQIVLAPDGLTMAALPFWTTESPQALAGETFEEFGFKLAFDEASTQALLASDALSELAASADIDPEILIAFRDRCRAALQEAAAFCREPNERPDNNTSPFRTAKWMDKRNPTKAIA
ncbi:hypothetical protein VQ574_21460 (plasmid) [Stutzerimonas frequens]|uniref:hypothetical protein n=1 Tax=Stutzerimonas frequens TaxID=2968969 RepID=UPI002DBE2220|nr:hypothetical protein [Stutzerimonas frequens]WRW29295.1 hypothetical protein VQ574_21460 [Stutzerimonas frequens]